MSLLVRVLRESGYLSEAEQTLLEGKTKPTVKLDISKGHDPGEKIMVDLLGYDEEEIKDVWGGLGRYTSAFNHTVRNRLRALVEHHLGAGTPGAVVISDRTRKPKAPTHTASGLYWSGGLTNKVTDELLKESFPKGEFTVRGKGPAWIIFPKNDAVKAAGGDFTPKGGEVWPAQALRARAIELDSFELKTNSSGSVLRAVPVKLTLNRKDFELIKEARQKEGRVEQSIKLSEAKRKFFSRTPGALEFWQDVNGTLSNISRAAGDARVGLVVKRGKRIEALKTRYRAYPEIVKELGRVHEVEFAYASKDKTKSSPTGIVDMNLAAVSYNTMKELAKSLRIYNKKLGIEVAGIEDEAAKERQKQVAGEPDHYDWGTTIGRGRPGGPGSVDPATGAVAPPLKDAPKEIEITAATGKGGRRGAGTWNLLRTTPAQGSIYEIVVKRLKTESDRTVAGDYGNKLSIWTEKRGGELSNVVLVGVPSQKRMNFEPASKSVSFSDRNEQTGGEEGLDDGDEKIRLIAVIRNAEQKIKRFN